MIFDIDKVQDIETQICKLFETFPTSDRCAKIIYSPCMKSLFAAARTQKLISNKYKVYSLNQILESANIKEEKGLFRKIVEKVLASLLGFIPILGSYFSIAILLTEISKEIVDEKGINDIEKYLCKSWKKHKRHKKVKYVVYLYTISYNILHNRLDCEECINDTYLATWNRIPPARPNALQRFLSKITRDISVDRYRKMHTLRQIPSELTVSIDELEGSMDGTIPADESEAVTLIGGILNAYLHGLTERERFMFVCRYYYADAVPFIAEMLGISDKTVYRELSKIREGLREALAREGVLL